MVESRLLLGKTSASELRELREHGYELYGGEQTFFYRKTSTIGSLLS